MTTLILVHPVAQMVGCGFIGCCCCYLLPLCTVQVALRGYLLVPPRPSASPTAPPVSSLAVPAGLGSISCLSCSLAGDLVAVGTDKGALLVWGVGRDMAQPPLFQVCAEWCNKGTVCGCSRGAV